MIGPVIASMPSYTIHSDMAVRKGNRLTCETGRSRANIQAEAEKLEAQKQTLWQEWDEKNAQLNARLGDRNAAQKTMQKADELSQRYRRGEITLAKYKSIQKQYQDQARERFVRIQQEKDAVSEEYGARIDEITRQQKALWRDNPAGRLTLTVLHQPERSTEMILPLHYGAPTDNFVAELNEAVEPFVATCGDANLAYVSHYYRDAFRYGEEDNPVISFRYNIEGNRLSPVACDTPMCRTVMATQGNSADPRDNPDLSLAGFIEGELAKAKNTADYRNAFAYEQGRREGIVYRLDPYWERYEGFDIARRIFEGEFGEVPNTPEFKAFYIGLATSYSKRCEAHVAQWQTFERKYDAYEGTDHNLDGSRTIHTSEQTKTYRIDARFGAHWAQFDSDLNRAVLDKGIFQGFGLVLGLHGEMESFLNNHACDSATVQQMTGNFIRAANGQPSVQQAGLRFAGAATESDAPTKTGTPPPPFTPVASAKEENETVNAAVKAFGGGGLFGEDWKKPKMSEKEFNREVDRVAGESQDNLNRAARNAEQSLDELDNATRDKTQHSQPQQQESTAQTTAERRERIRRIDQDTNEQIQALIQAQHQAQVEAAEEFRQKMQSASVEEQTRLLQDYRARQSAEGERMREQVQQLRAEANEKKRQL
tara:strand:+ start:5452 stop:7407 length:1956 start_codon:yes stop_codon:yes gene_type:complete